LASVDCTPAAAPDIPTLLAAIAARAEQTPPGRWIRATGYRETELRERRHPTRWELDAAAPAHPVRLIHAGGHGCVLNSRALALVGITTESEEPAGGYIGRRLEDGEPDGLLLGVNDLVERAVPLPAYDDLRAQVAVANSRLLAAGVTAVHDMGVRNDAATLALFERLRRDGALTVDVAAALGIAPFLDGNHPDGWHGMVKIVIEELGEERRPRGAELMAQIRAVHQRGARAAVHCIGRAAVADAIAAYAAALGGPAPERRHRLEHAAICTPALAQRAARLGLLAVCNPGFIRVNGDRYLRELPSDELPWLHNPATFLRAGIRAAIGSDAPVAPPNALGSIATATLRTTERGARIPGDAATMHEAFLAHTVYAAFAGEQEGIRGSIRPGAVADLVRLPEAAMRGGEEQLRLLQAGSWRDV
ncbi:MAG TPA: amidohydrolase family protein, partial [Dehalococcoidia bacterium]